MLHSVAVSLFMTVVSLSLDELTSVQYLISVGFSLVTIAVTVDNSAVDECLRSIPTQALTRLESLISYSHWHTME